MTAGAIGGAKQDLAGRWTRSWSASLTAPSRLVGCVHAGCARGSNRRGLGRDAGAGAGRASDGQEEEAASAPLVSSDVLLPPENDVGTGDSGNPS
jgi:hypothetical protein